MARKSPLHAHASVLDALARFPVGAGIEQLASALEAAPSRRTLQRWLNDLIDQERGVREGRSRAARYRCFTVHDIVGLAMTE